MALMAISAIFFTTGCTERAASSSDSVSDSMATDTVVGDTLSAVIEEETMPAAADELFDDFFFNFAASRRVQNNRIVFPLPYDINGKSTVVEQGAWKRERFFMPQGYYTLIVNSASQKQLAKDTSVCNVTVERISVKRGSVTRWHFSRIRGLWYLDNMRQMPLRQHPDAAFLSFYDKFSTDSAFQQKSLAETVSFTGPDPEDDFSTMSGDILPEQWPMFAPQLPSGTLYNIIYGAESYPASSTRHFMIRGISNGYQIDMTFIRKGKSWMLKTIVT